MLVAGFLFVSFKCLERDGNRKAQHQGDGKLEAVVGMKLEFREQVAAGDAQERSRTEREGATEEDCIRRRELTGSNIEHRLAMMRD